MSKSNNESRKTFSKYLDIMRMYSKRYKICFGGLLVLTIFIELFNTFSAYISAELMDFVNTNKNMHYVFAIAILMLGVYLVCTLVSVVRCYISSKISCALEYGIREDYLNIVQQSTYLHAISKESTEVYYRMLNDIGSMSAYFFNFRIDIPTSIITFVVCLALMIYWSPLMTVMILLFSAVQMIVSNVIKKPISVSTKEVIETENSFVKVVGDIFTGIENVKILGIEDDNQKKIKGITSEIKKKRIENTFIVSKLSSVAGLFGQFGAIAMLVIGCYLIINDRLTIGQYVGFMSVISLFSGSINKFVNFIFNFEKVRVSYERYVEFCKEYNIYEYGGTEKFLFNRELRLENVSFSYDDDRMIIDDLSYSFEKGNLVGIVGESGSGKSTLGKLIMRLLKPACGKIYIDDIEITGIHHKEYKDSVSYLSQIPYIFNGTIYDNLTLGMDKMIDNVYFNEVLQSTGVKNIIEKLENKSETIIGKGGALLSIGEMQRVAIARLLLRKPQIIILDEPTSSLNKKYDELVVDIFADYAKKQNALVIIITHKETSINKLEKVLRLVNGKLEND